MCPPDDSQALNLCPNRLEDGIEAGNFASAFRYAPIGMALVGIDGHFLQVNESLCRLTGYSDAELRALDFQTITHPEDLEIDLGLLHSLLAGNITSYRMEKRYQTKDRRWIWILLSVSLVLDHKGQPDHFVSQILDITDRKRMEEEMRAHRRQIQTIVDNVPEIVVRYDLDLRVRFTNLALQGLTGRPGDAYLGKTLEECGIPNHVCQVHREALAQVLATSQMALREYHYDNASGCLYYQLRLIPEFEETGEIHSFLAVSHDITAHIHAREELTRENHELEQLALYDALTGLKNRRAFDDRLRGETALALREGHPYALALLDIDHFKKVNDTLGHEGGDEVLRQVARILEDTLRPSDLVARYGGEEFALILTHTDQAGAITAAERCRDAIQSFLWAQVPVTTSVGVAAWVDEDPQTLLVRADLALYRAKNSGRNCVRLAGAD